MLTLQRQARVAQERADKAERERTDALIEVGNLQGHLTVLSERMAHMQRELEGAQRALNEAREEVALLNALFRDHIKEVRDARQD